MVLNRHEEKTRAQGRYFYASTHKGIGATNDRRRQKEFQIVLGIQTRNFQKAQRKVGGNSTRKGGVFWSVLDGGFARVL